VAAWHSAFNDFGLDALLGPGAHSTAVAHDTYGSMPYTVIFNLLDVSYLSIESQCHDDDKRLCSQTKSVEQYPSCLIPYSKASKQLDPEPVPSQVPGLPDCESSLGPRALF
jgi:amidase